MLPTLIQFGEHKTFLRILQAMAIKIETEHYRRYKNSFDETGKGFTMGALYWQLNDVWVAPTWSGIDYFGQWKMLQYYVKNAFSPIIVSGYIDISRDLNVFIISDLQNTITEVTLLMEVFSFSSMVPLTSTEQTIDIDAAKSNKVFSTYVDEYLSTAGCGTIQNVGSNCFIHLSLKKHGESISPDNFVLASAVKNLQVKKADLKIINVTQIDELGQSFSLTVFTDNIALYVWLDTHGIAGRFSENGFIQVNETKTIYFSSEKVVEIDRLKRTLTVTSLTDVNFK